MVETIVRGLVDRPDQVSARWTESERRVDVAVAPEDRGKVIGRRGKTIDSLRILASAVFAGEGERIDVRLEED
jgi:hypothetical protein